MAYFLIKTKYWGLDVAATSILVIISVFAVIIDINDLYGMYGINENHLTIPTVLLFCLQWTLVLLPLHYMGLLPLERHDEIKKPMLYVMLILIALSSVLVVLDRKEDIRDAMLMDMVDVKNAHYDDINTGGTSGEANYLLFIPKILSTLPFPTMSLFFWFYLLSFTKRTQILQVGILFASIAQAIIAITTAGRSALIYWAFDFYLLYCYFYKYLGRLMRLWVNISSAVVGFLGGMLFLIITVSRFDSGGRDALDSFCGYAGQHVNNFCTMIIERGDAPILTERIFPLLSKVLHGHNFELMEHYNKLNEHINVTVNVFDTFGGEVYLDLGWVPYLLMLIFFIILRNFIKYNWQSMKFYRVFFLILFVAFFTRGLFAWPFIGHYTTIAIIFYLFMIYLFRYKFMLRSNEDSNCNSDI